uniref:Outer capsid protein VP2 n=1 Tax=Changuinola virus TaxID=40052 RepID=U5YIA1_9REOV|nr:outer capsid protein VP2 [Changuinola virus]
MTTEFTIAVAEINNKLCHDSLFNDYDIVIDTSKKAALDNNGKWDMKQESARRNIYMWGTDRLIDDAIKGIPGAESYLCIANSIDSVLGELKDENLENRDKIQNQVSRELKWAMNMQSQEWKIDNKKRPIIECRYGSIHAQDHHFESLVYYRSAIPENKCSHLYLNEFNENIYTDLHNIVHNTIYLIDYTFKIKCIDNKPYRFPIGVIFPYKQRKQSDYNNKGKKENCFPEHFNTFRDNGAKGEKNIFLTNDSEADETDKDDNEEKQLEFYKRQLITINNEILEYKQIIDKNKHTLKEENIIYKMLEDQEMKKEDISSKIMKINETRSQCSKVNVEYGERKMEKLTYIPDDVNYIPKESELDLELDITHIFNGAYEHAMLKQIKEDGTLSDFQSKIIMDDKKHNTAEKILERYDEIKNQDNNVTDKWLDIKRSTMSYYNLKDEIISGYGPLKVEGALTPNKMADMRGNEKYKDLVALIEHGGVPVVKIDGLKLCKLFTEHSKNNPNNQIQFINDEDICKKFRNCLNTLFNQNIENEMASIDKIHKEGWTVHPINKKAFQIINGISASSQKQNIAKLGILISQVYGGYVDNNCPIHALRGGMLYANSFFGNVYDLLKRTFTWDISKTENNMGWKIPHKNMKIKPMTRMNVYDHDFIRGRAGICWNLHWGNLLTVDVNSGYPHFKEESEFTQSSFDNGKVNKFYQDMLNVDVWDKVHTELDGLLNDDAQFYIKNIQLDFYLDDKDVLITPSYYGKQIYYNVIANCNYKCVATQTHKTTSEKNEYKHTAAQRLLVPDNWFRPFQREYDNALICQGQAVYTTQQIRGRLERTFIDTIAKNEDFRKYVKQTEKEIIETQCPITYPSRYVPWKFFSQLFSLYINFMPLAVREKIQSNEKRIKIYPDIQMYDIDYDVTSIYSGIYRIFVYGYNALNLKNNRDIYLFLRNFQRAYGEERLHMLKNTIPQLYNIISDRKNNNIDEFFVINFLFLLCSNNINSVVQEETYVPICYCRSSNILITSIKLLPSNMKNSSSSYFPYLSRFFGLKQHKEWMNASEILIDMRNKAVDYFIGKIIVTISKELEICQTKHQNVVMWVGSKCGGVSECVVFFQAITFPKAAYMLIAIGDQHMNYDDVYREIRYNYQTSFESCKGIVLCKILDNEIIDFKVIGTLKVRKMLRNFWGLSHDMLLIKSLGDIFGNAHLVTKLMNI